MATLMVVDSKRFDWRLLLRGTISVLLLGWLLLSVNWLQIRGAFVRIDPLWLVPAAVWVVAAVAVSVVKWRLILQAQGLEVSWRELWRAYWIGLFFNNFLPSSIGGDAMRVVEIGKSTGDTVGVTASVVTERLLAALTLALVGLVASMMVDRNLLPVRLLLLALLGGVAVVTGLMLWGKVPPFLSKREGKMASFVKGFLIHGGRLGQHPRQLGWTLVWSVAFQLANVAVNYSLFQGLQLHQLNWWDAMFIIPATGAMAMLPLGINGYGVREGTYVLLLAPYGVERAIALAASVLFALLVSSCSLWGGLLWLGGCRKRDSHDSGRENI